MSADQRRRELQRARDKRTTLAKDVQSRRRKINDKRPKVAQASSESTRKTRQRELDRLERELNGAEGKVVDQDKAIDKLESKLADEMAAEQKKRDAAASSRQRTQDQRNRAVERDLTSLTSTTDALDARLSDVEQASMATLARAVAADPVSRTHDVFLSYATPDEVAAGNLRDELQARGLDVWMADAHVALGETLVTGIDQGIGSSRIGICFVTPAYIDPARFWPREELAGLIMGRKRVIPVVAGLSFEEVEAFSSLLGGRKGLSTADHGLDEIAELIVDSIGSTP